MLLLAVLAVCSAHNPEHDVSGPDLAADPLAPLAPPASPCPRVFRYEPGAAGWTGVVRLLAPPRFSALHLMVVFSAPQHLPVEPSPGTLSLRGGVAAGRALVRAAQQGRRKVIEFVADFSCSVTSVPSLLNVTANGRVFCAAEREPAGTLSTISLVADLETGLEWAAASDADFSIAPDGAEADKPPAAPPAGEPVAAGSSPCSVGANTPSVGSVPSPMDPATPYPVPPVDAYVPRDVLRPHMHLLPTAGRAPPTRPRLPPRRPTFEGAQTFSSAPTPRPTAADPTPAPPQPPPTEAVAAAAVRSDHQSDLHVDDEGCGIAGGAAANPLVTRGAAAVRGRWPWLVALFKKLGRRDQVGLNFECGASLLSRRHVVTAAHCVEVRGRRGRPVDAASLVVYLGKHDLLSYTEPGQQTAEVDAVRLHPEYGRAPSTASFDNDIALLVLSDAVEVNKYTRPVCLWDAGLGGTGVDAVVGRVGAVPGWGKDDTGAISNELRVANMPIVSQETCLRSNVFYHAFTSNTTFCAGFRNGTSVCNGDSGGGLFLQDGDGRWRIRGIVSVSMFNVNDQSCDSYNYAVFTDVAQYLPWLREEMRAAR